MEPSLLGLIELLLVFGIVFGFGFAPLASLRRDKRQRASKDATAGDDRPQPP